MTYQAITEIAVKCGYRNAMCVFSIQEYLNQNIYNRIMCNSATVHSYHIGWAVELCTLL